MSLVLTACQIGGGPIGLTGGPRVGQTVQVAMLLPMSGSGGDALLSRSLENAARLAASDVAATTTIDITVYDTGGDAATAATRAQEAISAGADVIVGPLRSDAAAAVGVAVANSNVAVLSFSNNTEIAGGNVLVLGYTFANTASRIVGYSARQGRGNIVVVHANNLAGEVARDAVRNAASLSGATISATIPYEFSQVGVVNVVSEVTAAVRSGGANAVLLTSDSAGALPLFAQLLPENGLDTSVTQMMGLTRWDIPPATLEFSGLQGGWFTLPDPNAATAFNSRYAAVNVGAPHALGGLGYDAVRAIAAAAPSGRIGTAELVAAGQVEGSAGAFRFLNDGTIERALAVAEIVNQQVSVIDPAPRRLGGPGL
ncbi:penicillin-binding protein activator [Jannaschia sp. CCS1]|uniref:penicillin-binding protein activator n=1 Tax=Jannaschia sp. (strain CCS1) TaxID=290400 RepID=UPI00006BFFAA|nr:penicillin-binding protein activator [Jannaschia sp. CCS1]ABD53815.1 amino acid/amide ABC transporter substrate-binding protein, HAAT family [Jannaschia sp. CCS1]